MDKGDAAVDSESVPLLVGQVEGVALLMVDHYVWVVEDRFAPSVAGLCGRFVPYFFGEDSLQPTFLRIGTGLQDKF